MPVVTFDADALRRLIGSQVSTATLAERMPMMGGDLDGVDGEQITIEWFPDRPDLLPLEGTARALRAFLDIQPGMRLPKVDKPRTHLDLDSSVAEVRPHAALCFVRGVRPDPGLVQALVAAQEKLTVGPGRRRRKLAIGVHDAAGLVGPFRYTTVGREEVRFVPLQADVEMTPQEILERHPKGREYGHLVGPRVPMFLDGKGRVVSMPPVINAASTAVTDDTTEFLVDVTGTDQAAVDRTASLLAACLAMRGGTVEAIEVRAGDETRQCPDMHPQEQVLHTDDVERLLGLQLSGDEVAACLRRMGHDAEAFDTRVLVQSPPWRSDLLHPVDWMEDVAIGYGFDAFPGTLPKTGTFGGALPHQDLEERFRTTLCGLGFAETRTLTLTHPDKESVRWGAAQRPAVSLLNPSLEEQTHVRTRLLPGLLEILAQNRHRALPQRLWEFGEVVREKDGAWRNVLRFAAVETGARTGFADARALVEALARDTGCALRLEEADVPGFIAGRAGTLHAGQEQVGHFGELHPDTLLAFRSGAATVAVEFDVEPFL